MDGEIAVVRAFEELPHPAESPLSITLVQAIPKKEKMGFIVEKATELGVHRILPCLSTRAAAEGVGGGKNKSHRWRNTPAGRMSSAEGASFPSFRLYPTSGRR